MRCVRGIALLLSAPLLLALLLTSWGCGGGGAVNSPGSFPAPAPAGNEPDLRGVVESTAPFRPAPGSDIIGVYMITAVPGLKSCCDRASVTVTHTTRILEGASVDESREIESRYLSPGTRVDVWFVGPVAESYPVQGAADIILVLPDGVDSAGPDESDIYAVKDRHAVELMAIPGVVGVGIEEDSGLPCIVVMLVDESPELREKIPSQLDGFRVKAVVTGEIHPL